MNVVKIVGAIPLIGLGILGACALAFGEGGQLSSLCVTIGTLTPGLCLLIIGVKNFAGAENPVADTIAVGASLIVAIVCAIAFALSSLALGSETGSGAGGDGQPENIDGIEWVLYFGDIDMNETEIQQLQDEVKEEVETPIETSELNKDANGIVVEATAGAVQGKADKTAENMTNNQVMPAKKAVQPKQQSKPQSPEAPQTSQAPEVLQASETPQVPEKESSAAAPVSGGVLRGNENGYTVTNNGEVDWQNITMLLFTSTGVYEYNISFLAKGEIHNIDPNNAKPLAGGETNGYIGEVKDAEVYAITP